MKVEVRYATEFGSSATVINVTEIPSFAKRFKLLSVNPHKELSTKLHIGEIVDESYPEAFRKQETLEEVCPICETNRLIDGACKECTELLCKPISVIEKQETLEEAFDKIDDNFIRYSTEESEFWTHYKIGVMDGLQYKQERSYNEEEVNNLISDILYKVRFNYSDIDIIESNIEDLFERFKKK